ncbi:tail fiber protein [Streptococcus phage Javan290]|uniref:hypothetical protein n=1 Tax=Streptococcus marmotae TaxID=1825069 RepID=UPI000831A414|nr:hypothetical protein [Streptococcus marmotae]QBX16941.1 hypothetical protein Javan291_0065 [Streptococcus phage Javan291]QBX26058.1 tail fiber protein [Streptococcus phage Javan290]
MHVLTNLDLRKNQLLNAIVQNLGTAPGDPKAGQLYFDTTEKKLKIYTGDSWVGLDSNENSLDTDQISTIAGNKATDALNTAKQYVNDEIAKVVGGADGEYDTLKEIEAFIKTHAEQLTSFASAPHKFVTEIGDGVAVEHTVTHSLNTQDVLVEVYEANAPNEKVLVDIEHTDANTIKITTARAIPENAKLKVVVIG